MSRRRPSSSLGFYAHDADADGPSSFAASSTEQPQLSRRGSINLFRRRSQVLDSSNMKFRGNRHAGDASEDRGIENLHGQPSTLSLAADIGQAPTPSKPAKSRGFGLRRPEGLSIARFGSSVSAAGAALMNRSPAGSSLAQDDASTSDAGVPARKSINLARRVLSPRNEMARQRTRDDDDARMDPPRTSSAMDFYRKHGPMQGLASKEWLPQSADSRSVSQTSTLEGKDEQQVAVPTPESQDFEEAGRSRPRSISLTMANLVRRPSMRSSQSSAAQGAPQDQRTSNAPQDNDDVIGESTAVSQNGSKHEQVNTARASERPSRPPTSPSARFQPQSISRSAASPFLNTFTAKAYRREKSSAPPESDSASARPRRKGLPAALRPRDNTQGDAMSQRSSTPDQSTSSDVYDTSSPEAYRPAGMPHKLRHLRSPSVSALDEMPSSPQPRSPFRFRLQSQEASPLSRLTSRLPLSPSLRKQTGSPKGSEASTSVEGGVSVGQRRNDKSKELVVQVTPDEERDIPARAGSPFGMHANTSLQTLGTHIGGVGAAVGRRGWDFVRNWGGAQSHAQSGGLGRQSPSSKNLTVHDDRTPSNAATAAWYAALDDGDRSPMRHSPALQSPRLGLVFGIPLREAVLRTRLGRSAAPAKDSRQGPQDVISGYRLQLRGVGQSVQVANRAPVSRQEARLKYLPALVVRCIEAVERWGYEEEGIYRLSGRSSHTTKLQQIFDGSLAAHASCDSTTQMGDLDLAVISPADLDLNSVCSMLKAYLRTLPDTIIPKAGSTALNASLSQNCGLANAQFAASGMTISGNDLNPLEVSAMLKSGNKPTKERLCESLKPAIDALPAANWYLLRELASHLSDMTRDEVVQNTRMPLSNLCLVLAPTLSLSVPIVQAIVQHVEELFRGPAPAYDAELDELDLSALLQMDESLDVTTTVETDPAEFHTSPDLLVSHSSNDDSNRLSVATVKVDENRQSIASVSTLQHDATVGSGAGPPSDELVSPSIYTAAGESPIPPVAAKFLRSPSMLSLHESGKQSNTISSESLLRGPLNVIQLGAESSSADSSLPSSYWTGGDHESVASSILTDDNCAHTSPGMTWMLPGGLASSASTTSLSGDRSESASSISGQSSALDRPRPPTRGRAKFLAGATRILRPSRFAAGREGSSAMSSSTSASSSSSAMRPNEGPAPKVEMDGPQLPVLTLDAIDGHTEPSNDLTVNSLLSTESELSQDAPPQQAAEQHGAQVEAVSAQSTPVL